MQNLIAVRIANPGNRGLISKQTLELTFPTPLQDVGKYLQSELIRKRLWPQTVQSFNIVRTADNIDGELLLSSGLGQIKAT